MTHDRFLEPCSPLLMLALLGVPSSPITAQRLVGGAFSPAGGPLLATKTFCAASVRLCSPILAAPPTNFAGGTAYDPIHQVIWDTDGLRLIGILALAAVPCATPYCPAVALPLPANALATGLAFDESRDAVWMIDSSPSLSLLRISATSRCPTLSARCDLTPVVPTTHATGSLAFSERRQLVLWSSSVFTGGAAANIVYVAAAANPCVVTCRITLFGTVGCGGAPLGPITGMAYDDCTDRIYVTDGTAVLRATYLPPCGANGFQCCAAAAVAPFYGLDLEPAHPTSVGGSCMMPPCAACLAVTLTTSGDPTIGNAAFALRIQNAPAGSFGMLAFHPGACGAGLPLFCGLYHPAALPPAVLFGPVALVGGGACTAAGAFPLPVPLAAGLCGQRFCTQGVILCIGAGLGVGGLTNAVDFVIGDS